MTGDQQDDVTCSKGILKDSFWNQHFSGMINPSVKNITVGSIGKKEVKCAVKQLKEFEKCQREGEKEICRG